MLYLAPWELAASLCDVRQTPSLLYPTVLIHRPGRPSSAMSGPAIPMVISLLSAVEKNYAKITNSVKVLKVCQIFF